MKVSISVGWGARQEVHLVQNFRGMQVSMKALVIDEMREFGITGLVGTRKKSTGGLHYDDITCCN